MTVSSVRPSVSMPAARSTSSSPVSSSSASTATGSSGASGWLETGMSLLGGLTGSGGAEGGGSKEDQTKAMIDAFIFGNLEKMREEASKKLEEAMKKRG